MAKKRYSKEFKAQIVREVLRRGDLVGIAEDYCVPVSTVRTWVKKCQIENLAQERISALGPPDLHEQRLLKENYMLRRLLEEKEQENQHLKEQKRRREWWDQVLEAFGRLLRLMLYVLRIKI